MTTEKDIRDRFLECINEAISQGTTLTRIAESIKTTQPYLSQIRTRREPKIPAAILARFCLEYRFSPYYILCGVGNKQLETREDKLIEMLSQVIAGYFKLEVEGEEPPDFKDLLKDVSKELADQSRKKSN